MSDKKQLPDSFGFVDGDYYTTRTFQACLLAALGFSYELTGPDDRERCLYRIYTPETDPPDMTLQQAVRGIHNPTLLKASFQEKVAFYRLAQEFEQKMLDQIRALKNAAKKEAVNAEA
jgi:hypothetical protein